MKKIILSLFLLLVVCPSMAHIKPHDKHHKKHYKKSTIHRSKQVKKIPESYINAHTNVVLINVTDNSVVTGNYDSEKVSIASISKLMTIYTVLRANQNFDEILTVQSKLSNHTRLSKGMKLTRGDLVKLSLIHSDNLAAVTLSEYFPGGKEMFITAMNKNAKELGMHDTVFYEPTGLDANNSSTLRDIAILTNAASNFATFREAARTENLVIHATKGNKQISIHANPTSKLFGKDGIITIKTGFTNAAGFCITLLLLNDDHKLYNLVILGAKSSQERKNIIEKSLQMLHTSWAN